MKYCLFFLSIFVFSLALAKASFGQEPIPIRIIFAGDTHFQWAVQDQIQKGGTKAPFKAILPFFKTADFRIVNLETAIATKGEPLPGKSHIFNSPRDNLSGLQFLGVDLAVLANNHSMDMGAEGLADTISNLRHFGIPSVGSGMNDAEAVAPFFTEIRGVKIAILAFNEIEEGGIVSGPDSAGVATASKHGVLAIRAAKRQADVVIVSLHWGMEYLALPEAAQRRLAFQLIQAGADMIVGHHPHIPQGMEIAKDSVVLYSIGNFLFGSANHFQTHNLVAEILISQESKTINAVRLHPVFGRFRDGQPEIRKLTTDEAADLIAEYQEQAKILSPRSASKLTILEDGIMEIVIAQGKPQDRAQEDPKQKQDSSPSPTLPSP